MRLFLNALGFQTAWWACIAGVGHGLEIPALVYGLVLAAVHVTFAPKPRLEIQLAAIALALGVTVDTLLQATSVIQFYGWSLAFLSPFWLWLLWVLFCHDLDDIAVILANQAAVAQRFGGPGVWAPDLLCRGATWRGSF